MTRRLLAPQIFSDADLDPAFAEFNDVADHNKTISQRDLEED